MLVLLFIYMIIYWVLECDILISYQHDDELLMQRLGPIRFTPAPEFVGCIFDVLFIRLVLVL